MWWRERRACAESGNQATWMDGWNPIQLFFVFVLVLVFVSVDANFLSTRLFKVGLGRRSYVAVSGDAANVVSSLKVGGGCCCLVNEFD